METDISQIISQTINNLFQQLFSSIDNNLYAFLDEITFIDSSLLNDSHFEKVMGTSPTSGILLIANSLIIAFLLYYSIRFFLSAYTSSALERPYQFLFKLVIVAILANSSYFICEVFLHLNSLFSSSIRNIGESLFQKNICFTSLIKELNALILLGSDSLNIFSLDGILKSFCSFGLFNLVFSYSLRFIMIKVCVLISPFAFLSLSLNSSKWFFQIWLRSFLSLLLLQSLISFIFLIIFSFSFAQSLYSKFIYIGSIYALIKANSYMKEWFGGITTEVNNNLSSLRQILK